MGALTRRAMTRFASLTAVFINKTINKCIEMKKIQKIYGIWYGIDHFLKQKWLNSRTVLWSHSIRAVMINSNGKKIKNTWLIILWEPSSAIHHPAVEGAIVLFGNHDWKKNGTINKYNRRKKKWFRKTQLCLSIM